MKNISPFVIFLFLSLLGLLQDKEVIAVTNPDSLKTFTINQKDTFIVVDQMPIFNKKDGIAGFQKYIIKNLRYPSIASNNNIQGTVYVQFIINKSGKVTDAVLIKGVNPALDEEALRVINNSPIWYKPGMSKGRPVRVKFKYPVNFRLHMPKKKKNSN